MSQSLMNPVEVNRLTEELNAALHESGLSGHLKRIWVFKGRAFVADFGYKGVDFGIDIEVGDTGACAVTIVQRGKLGGGISVVAGERRKQVLVTDVPEGKAVPHVVAALSEAMARIDAYYDSAPAVAPLTNGPRVGLLTLPLSRNYGGNLQAFALMQVLRDLGCNPLLLNRRYAAEAPTAAAKDAPQPPIVNRINMGKPCDNISFIERHILPISRPYYAPEELRDGIGDHGLDAVVSGSDQVWRPNYARGLLRDFFHGYLPAEDRSVRRISYAASFGSESWEYDARQTRMAADLLSRFDAVSVREDSAVEMVRKYLGVESQHVLDPTLLLEPDRYGRLVADRLTEKVDGRLTTYILDQSPEKQGLLTQVAERLDLQPLRASERVTADGKRVVDKSVEGWLAAFQHADFVFTDSFHGVAFSILFNKPFIAFGNPLRGMARFTSILHMFGLEDRLVIDAASADPDMLVRPIDWECVNDRLEELRAQSIDFLRKALELPGRPETGGRSRDLLANATTVAATAPAGRAQADIFGAAADSPMGKLCTGCGLCVSESQGGLEMGWDKDGFLGPRATGLPIPATAGRVCPFNPVPAPEVRDEDALGRLFHADAPNDHARGGRFRSTYVGYSVAHRPTSSSGGIATYVFEQLLKRQELQRLFVVRGDTNGGYSYSTFEPGEDITLISKTRYYPVTLENLFRVIAETEGKIGVSGVACFMKALRLKQHYDPVFRDRVAFMAGIICGGLKSRFYTDFLAGSAGIAQDWTNAQYRVKNPEGEANDYFFAADDANGRVRKVRMRRLGDMWGSGLFKNKACDFCTDVTTELADISLGDAWIPEYNKDGMGNSVVVTRSALADRIIREGIEAGELVMAEVSMDKIVRSQSGGVNHKLNALAIRHWLAETYTGLPVPAFRTRHKKEVNAAEMLVQVLRERVRGKSLRFWRESGDLRSFNRRMRASRERLGAATAARKKQSENVYDMLLADLVPHQPRRENAVEIREILPLVRWLRRKVHAGELDLAALQLLLPDDQKVDFNPDHAGLIPQSSNVARGASTVF